MHVSALNSPFKCSGFLLGVLYQDKLGEWHQRKTFWVKRFARLAPMYWFSLIFCLPPFIAYSFQAWMIHTYITQAHKFIFLCLWISSFFLNYKISFTVVPNNIMTISKGWMELCGVLCVDSSLPSIPHPGGKRLERSSLANISLCPLLCDLPLSP